MINTATVVSISMSVKARERAGDTAIGFGLACALLGVEAGDVIAFATGFATVLVGKVGVREVVKWSKLSVWTAGPQDIGRGGDGGFAVNGREIPLRLPIAGNVLHSAHHRLHAGHGLVGFVAHVARQRA